LPPTLNLSAEEIRRLAGDKYAFRKNVEMAKINLEFYEIKPV